MVEGILISENNGWFIVKEDGKKVLLDPEKKTELEMEGKWIKSQITVQDNAILVDKEVELGVKIVNEMRIKMRQY